MCDIVAIMRKIKEIDKCIEYGNPDPISVKLLKQDRSELQDALNDLLDKAMPAVVDGIMAEIDEDIERERANRIVRYHANAGNVIFHALKKHDVLLAQRIQEEG